ncbi:MAG: Fe-S protein assembly co-chaperone HscB [Planctomycetes bacterium]|nr:Fe-S protein assembly co-chaperone HscB [Planctomycetota bacterium]
MPAQNGVLPAKCTRCAAELLSPVVCSGCQSIYPMPSGVDHFQLLGLERTFRLDEARVKASFRALARSVHPDHFTGASGEVAALATRLSAAVNEAVAVLSDPLRRADYLLTLAGGPSAVEVREVPGSLLTEVMILREQIEEARSAGRNDELERLRATLSASRGAALETVAARADSLPQASLEERREFRKLLNSIRYYDNLLSEVSVDPMHAAKTTHD